MAGKLLWKTIFFTAFIMQSTIIIIIIPATTVVSGWLKISKKSHNFQNHSKLVCVYKIQIIQTTTKQPKKESNLQNNNTLT